MMTIPRKLRTPDYRAGMAADRLRHRAEIHMQQGRAHRAADMLSRALDLARKHRLDNPACLLLCNDLYPLWSMAQAAAEGQTTTRRELAGYHTSAAGDFDITAYRMQA